jgi:hypothetical protein
VFWLHDWYRNLPQELVLRFILVLFDLLEASRRSFRGATERAEMVLKFSYLYFYHAVISKTHYSASILSTRGMWIPTFQSVDF